MAAKKQGGAARYGTEVKRDIEREMNNMKQGQLVSGSGQKVTNPKQAIAIALSEARKAGEKVPSPPVPPPAKKASTNKTPAKKTAAKKTAAKKTAAKKAAAKKAPAKQAD